MYQHAVCDGVISTYMFQPGDATRYTFSLVRLDSYNQGIGLAKDGDYDTADVYGIVSGVSESYVMLIVHMPSSQGSYEFARTSLRQPWANYFHDYARSKMRQVDEYTLKAILLAVSVLVDEPDNLDEAGKKMLLMKDNKWRDENGW